MVPRIDDVVRWLHIEGSAHAGFSPLLDALHGRLLAVGIPVDRVWHAYFVLHPELAGRSWVWRPGLGLTDTEVPHGGLPPARTATTPLERLLHGEPDVRVRLSATAELDARSAELRDEGYTDYWVAPGPKMRPNEAPTEAPPGATSASLTAWATRVPDGWTDAQIDALRRVHAALSLVTEVIHQRLICEGLLRAYLGADAGSRVLAGQVRRGDVRRVEAAVLFTDLRDFTRRSEVLGPDALLDWMNDAFDAQIEAIEHAGGAVLQIVGDGLLAIFESNESAEHACSAALDAVHGIRSAIDSVNRARVADGKEAIGWGAALHYGEVRHGNFGSRARLAFTANGPAVNRAARLEGLGAALGLLPALSEEFAGLCGCAVLSHGTHEAKGVGPIAVWSLAPNPSPA